MAIDASIYGQIQAPPPVSPLDNAQKVMTLAQLGYQQQQQQIQMQTRTAMMQAYAHNTDPQTGQVDKQGVVSFLARVNPMAAQDLQTQFAGQDKAQAEAKQAQLKAAKDAYDITGPAFDYMAALPGAQRAAAYPKVIEQLKAQGVDTSRMDHPYDDGLFNQYYGTWQKSKPALENQLTQANIGKTRAETARDWAEAGAPAPLKLGAEELGKFNEDVNNPTSRKTTGGLKDIINRADRIVALANAGALPHETPEQRTARLNKIMPQIAKEYNLSLAYLMQGGVPSEGLAQELGTDTNESAIAKLKQQFTNTPEGADQGKMIQAYVDTAQHLRNFAAGRLQETTDRARAAYPYANKYFRKEMDQIGAPIASPGPSGMDGALTNGTDAAPGAGPQDRSWVGRIGKAVSKMTGGEQGASAAVAKDSAAPKSQYRAAGSAVSADQVAQYATRHGMKLKEAQSYLKGKGYVIGN